MAALTVQGGLVKNKMKGGSLYQTKRVFFSIGTPVSVNNFLFEETVSVNKKYLTDTPHGNFFLVRKR